MATTRKPVKKVEIGTPKLPISFDQFKKNPIAAVAFCMLIAVGYLYFDQKSIAEASMEECRNETKQLKIIVYDLQEKYRKSDSMMSAANSKITILQQLNKIPN